MILPEDKVSNVQFGLRRDRSADFGTTLLHEITCYFNDKNYPVFVGGLAADKCFVQRLARWIIIQIILPV